MITDLPTSAGLLVIRVWREGPDPTAFRARVTSTLDLLGQPEQVVTTNDPDAVWSLVSDWLAALGIAHG